VARINTEWLEYGVSKAEPALGIAAHSKCLKSAILTEARGKSEALCIASFYNSGAFWPDSKGGVKKRSGGNENPGSVFALLVV
jgi:hypothetical protein